MGLACASCDYEEVTYAIPLTRGQVAIIDAKDLALVGATSWHAHVREDGGFYARSNRTYMHRVIAGAKAGEEVDHWDGEGLHNTRRNLRCCSRAQNLTARRHTPRSNPAKGVRQTGKSRFQANLSINGRRVSLGTYPSVAEAEAAYLTAAKARYAEFSSAPPPEPECPICANLLLPTPHKEA